MNTLVRMSVIWRWVGLQKFVVMIRENVEEFYRRLAEADPAPKGELNYVNEYTLLVAVVLSAQATDVGVNRATRKLFEIADTPEKMVKLGKRKLISHIKTIGLYRTKAQNVIGLSKKLITDHESKVPKDRDTLIKLPGVGRKTANVVLNIAFGFPTIAVDTHIFRIGNRTGIARGKNVDIVERGLLKKTPKKYMLHAHHWLILHGRYVCKARKPNCPDCMLSDLCQYKEKTMLAK
jgi:endonuclease-3